MSVNKVVYDGSTLIDLTNDSVTPGVLLKGVTAHDASGAKIVGTAVGGLTQEEVEAIVLAHSHSEATETANGLMSAADKTKLNYSNIAYATCATAAATAAKVATLSGNTKWALTEGSIIAVKFTYSNTASNPTLNVNSTGAKSVVYGTAALTTSNLTYAGYAKRTILYVYNGSQYVFLGWSYDANSDTKVQQIAATTQATEFPVLLGYDERTSAVTGSVNKSSSLLYNPSTKVLTAPTVKGALDGNAATATKSTQDSQGQQINATYIKSLSLSSDGKILTYTKGDGTTGTIELGASGASMLLGVGEPTTATVGEIGQMYMNTADSNVFVCTAIVGGEYKWGLLGSPITEITTWSETIAKTASTDGSAASAQDTYLPYYYCDNSGLRGVHLKSVAFAVGTANTPVTIGMSAARSQTAFSEVLLTITPTSTEFTTYDLTDLSDSRFSNINEATLDNGRFFVPTNRYIGFGARGESCKLVYRSSAAANTANRIYSPYNGGTEMNKNLPMAVTIVTGEPTTQVIGGIANTILGGGSANLAGKKVSILGDSISTFDGYIPSGNVAWYGKTSTDTTMDSADKTWWKQLIDNSGAELLVNNSYAGSRMASGGNYSTAAGYLRCTSLHDGTTNPDIIIVYLGANDFQEDVALGTYDGSTAVPTTYANFSTAYGYALDKMMQTYPSAQIYCCTLPHFTPEGSSGTHPESNGSNTIAEYNTAIENIAHNLGAKVIRLDRCGITWRNKANYFLLESNVLIHPNADGHKLIATEAMRTLLYNE